MPVVGGASRSRNGKAMEPGGSDCSREGGKVAEAEGVDERSAVLVG